MICSTSSEVTPLYHTPSGKTMTLGPLAHTS